MFFANSAAAAEMAPGLWRFTQTTQTGGRGAAKEKTRCVTAAQARAPAQFFQPRGPGCTLASHSSLGNRMTSALRCTQGDTTSEVSTVITFTSATEMAIATTVTVTSPRGRATASLSGAGQRVGDCGRRRR